MLFQPGFLGTKALMYMDIVTVYFAVLPLLLMFAIYQAMNKNYSLHIKSHIAILSITLLMVIVFEAGVRLSGGFALYAPQSKLSYDFLVIFLSIHIFIAIIAVGGWMYLVISSYNAYSKHQPMDSAKHKKMGKWIFAAITVTSIMGTSIYCFLFL